jgi:hypothetical protein
VPQQSRLRGLGVPETELVPSHPEVAMAARAMAAGPGAVLVALRQARGTADAADARVARAGAPGPLASAAGWVPWLRNLLVYGPFAVLALFAQLLLYVAAGGQVTPALALFTALLLPVVAFGAAWFTVGLLFPAAPGRRPDRTAAWGVLVCLVPALLSCAVAAVLATSG